MRKGLAIDKDNDNLLAFLMSIITLISGIVAAINQLLRLNNDDEEDEDLEILVSEMDEVEARLDEHEAQLATLLKEKQ